MFSGVSSMKMHFLRIEKGFDSHDYVAVFDCEDIIGTEHRKWQIKYDRKQIERMLRHPVLGTEMRRVLDSLKLIKDTHQ